MIIAYRMGREDIDDQAKLPRIPERLVPFTPWVCTSKALARPEQASEFGTPALCLCSRKAATA